MTKPSIGLWLLLGVCLIPGNGRTAEEGAARHAVRIEVRDAEGRPLPCRIHLIGPSGKPIEAPGLPFFRDHFACDGDVELSLPAGAYRHEIERGPEHERASGSFDPVKWWAGLKAGRSFVTNGPLLVVKANGELPGHVFRMAKGAPLSIGIEASLVSNDTVPAIEVIRDGRAAGAMDVGGRKAEGKTFTLTFERSGWFLVRAIADEKRTFRFASTAPFWVEAAGDGPRISRASARFFIEWVEERIARVRSAVKSEKEVADVLEVLAHHERALKFWGDLRDRANAE